MIKTTNAFTKFDSKNNELVCQGEWTLANLNVLKTEFNNISWPSKGTLTVNGAAIDKMDSAGALALKSAV